MKKQLFYRTSPGFRTYFSRQARLLIAVITRQNFGERYFRLKNSIIVVIILGLYPIIKVKILNFIAMIKAGITPLTAGFSSMIGGHSSAMSPETGYNGQEVEIHTLFPYLGWYVYLAVFLALSIRHYLDLKRKTSVFDFNRFSMATGELNPFFARIFLKIKIQKVEINLRIIHCFVEPGLFFLAGLALWLAEQNLGILLMVCGVVDCLATLREYEAGDNYILDQIDQRMIAEEMEAFFLEDNFDHDDFGGLRITKKRPDNAEENKAFYETYIKDQEEAFEVD